MDDLHANNPRRTISLTVLPNSGKVDRLKADPPAPMPAAADPPDPSGPAAPSSSYVPHVNRTRPGGKLTEAQKAVEEKVIAAVRTVYDPEIPLNLYDLGLIYDINIDAENNVNIRMTLTAPGCPVADMLPPQVESKVECVPEVKRCTVELVWDPPWSKEMLSEAARLELGFV